MTRCIFQWGWIRADIYQNRAFQRNIDSARTNLDLTESTMGTLTEVLQQIRTLAVQGRSIDPARMAIAEQVEKLFGQVLDLATRIITDNIFSEAVRQETLPLSAGMAVLSIRETTISGMFSSGRVTGLPPILPEIRCFSIPRIRSQPH